MNGYERDDNYAGPKPTWRSYLGVGLLFAGVVIVVGGVLLRLT